MMIATRPSGFVVKKGEKLCGTRIIPLVIEKEKMQRAKEAAARSRSFSCIRSRKRPLAL